MAMRSKTSFPTLLEHDQLKCDVIASCELAAEVNFTHRHESCIDILILLMSQNVFLKFYYLIITDYFKSFGLLLYLDKILFHI